MTAINHPQNVQGADRKQGMAKKLTGGCLCGAVTFSIEDRLKAFYLCHCKQCRQLTGTAFASNITTDKDNINWDSGHGNVSVFEHSSREFSKSFCKLCGSALPFINKSKTSLVIPAGSLNEMPEMKPQANIFTDEEARWLSDGVKAESFPAFVDK